MALLVGPRMALTDCGDGRAVAVDDEARLGLPDSEPSVVEDLR